MVAQTGIGPEIGFVLLSRKRERSTKLHGMARKDVSCGFVDRLTYLKIGHHPNRGLSCHRTLKLHHATTYLPLLGSAPPEITPLFGS
jgi:hypothetical protein